MADTGTEPPGAAGPGASRSGPPRWIWWVAGLVMVAFVVAIALNGSSDDSSSTTTTTAADTLPAGFAAELGQLVLPSFDGFRIVAPASGREALSRAEIEGRSGPQVVPVPGTGAVGGWRRDFESTSSDDVVRVVLLRMRTPAAAARAERGLQAWWVKAKGDLVDTAVPVGRTTVTVGTKPAADANGDHPQLAVGTVGRTVFVILRVSKDASTDTSALLTATTDQALRLRAP